MTRMNYQTVLRAKGIKPIRKPAHTIKNHGDLELLPVKGVHRHVKLDWDDLVTAVARTPAPRTPFLELLMGEMA